MRSRRDRSLVSYRITKIMKPSDVLMEAYSTDEPKNKNMMLYHNHTLAFLRRVLWRRRQPRRRERSAIAFLPARDEVTACCMLHESRPEMNPTGYEPT